LAAFWSVVWSGIFCQLDGVCQHAGITNQRIVATKAGDEIVIHGERAKVASVKVWRVAAAG
jgi:hypothetical protein